MSQISVIIPIYNCEEWISITIESCLIHMKYIKEIVIIDDFSNDKSWDIIKFYQHEYPDIIKSEQNAQKGANNARNQGLEISTGDYIQWLDADDQIIGNKFELQLDFLIKNPNIDIVYSDWRLDTYNESKMKISEEYKYCQNQEDYLFQLLIDNWVPLHCYLMRKKVAEQMKNHGGWNIKTAILQDREYFTICAILGNNFGYVKGIFVVYNRWNRLSISAGNNNARNTSLVNLLDRFDYLIRTKELLKYPSYLSYINTQRLFLKACGVDVSIDYRKFTFFDIKWSIVPGIRTKLKVFYAYFYDRYH